MGYTHPAPMVKPQNSYSLKQFDGGGATKRDSVRLLRFLPSHMSSLPSDFASSHMVTGEVRADGADSDRSPPGRRQPSWKTMVGIVLSILLELEFDVINMKLLQVSCTNKTLLRKQQ